MKVTKNDLASAAEAGVISRAQAESLWEFVERKASSRPQFDLSHVAYYFGALIVMSAMGWFMTLGWQRFGGHGLFIISLAYAISFALAGYHLWFKENLRVPGGLLFTLAVWMTPLVIYGFEAMTGLWPQDFPGAYRGYYEWVKGSWFAMEVGTIIVGLAALRFIRFPFLTFPIAFSLWFMSMDLTPLIYSKKSYSWDESLWVSLFFGLAMILAAYFIDHRTNEDYAFWGYLFGMMAFWGGLSLMESGSELKRFLYCMINVGLMLASVLLQRKVFIIFGAAGVFGYLSYLSYRVFSDSLMFPVVLTVLGLLVIYLGIKYQRHHELVESTVVSIFPNIARLRPKDR